MEIARKARHGFGSNIRGVSAPLRGAGAFVQWCGVGRPFSDLAWTRVAR